jgi:ubiquinone/menaquinone biosynthesis C-methylase UbiE
MAKIVFPKYRRSPFAMKRLYNKISRFYGVVEGNLGAKLNFIVNTRIATIPEVKTLSALEYACGSGLLSLKLATIFHSVTGRDQSVNMLERARSRASRRAVSVHFTEGNILEIDDAPKSYDYVFVSFALHLFSPVTIGEILSNLCRIARRGVVVIDHGRNWNFGVAILEWFEGGYYDQFIRMDFSAIASEIGCTSFQEEQVRGFTILTFITAG